MVCLYHLNSTWNSLEWIALATGQGEQEWGKCPWFKVDSDLKKRKFTDFFPFEFNLKLLTAWTAFATVKEWGKYPELKWKQRKFLDFFPIEFHIKHSFNTSAIGKVLQEWWGKCPESSRSGLRWNGMKIKFLGTRFQNKVPFLKASGHECQLQIWTEIPGWPRVEDKTQNFNSHSLHASLQSPELQ